MIELLFIRSAHDEFWRRNFPNGGVFASLPKPGRIFLPNEPRRLVGEPVRRPRENRPVLMPNNLLMMQKADPQQAVENLAGEFRSVPDVADLETGHECESFRPVCTGVARDFRLRVALSAMFHVAGLGRPVLVQARAISPFRIQ